MLPSLLTASARGVSPKRVMIESGVPPGVEPGFVASNAQTSARPTPGLVSWGSPAPDTLAIDGSVRCCPRCAHVMKTRVPPSANTMSRGSSPTSRVRLTRGWLPDRSTMLTLSERWFTTHTSVFVRAATVTGSSPTGTVWVE